MYGFMAEEQKDEVKSVPQKPINKDSQPDLRYSYIYAQFQEDKNTVSARKEKRNRH